MKKRKTLYLQAGYCWIYGEITAYIYECDECDRKVCSDCIHTEYNNFSHYDGSVNVDTLCDCCSGRIYYTLKGQQLGYAV